MSDRPAPIVSADIDLRNFVYMPLDVVRLRDSDIAALVSAEAFRAAVLLWCAAWHQLPAASLPDDDQALSRLAGYGRDLAGWRKVKEGALRGFVACSDGRLYHPVIAEKAISAWDAKKAQRARTEAATAARLAKQRSDSAPRNDNRDDPRNVERDEGGNERRHDLPDEHVTFTKGRERRGEENNVRDARNIFDREFWLRYPHKVGKPAALRSFERLYCEMGGHIEPMLEGLKRYIASKPTDRSWLNPATFLNQRRFEDQPASASTHQQDATSCIDFGGGISWPETTVLQVVSRWRSDPTSWPSDRIGPPPGAPGCMIPDRLLQEAA